MVSEQVFVWAHTTPGLVCETCGLLSLRPKKKYLVRCQFIEYGEKARLVYVNPKAEEKIRLVVVCPQT